MTLTTLPTANLIGRYEEAIRTRYSNVTLGSSRWVARQNRIDALVDELSRRADEGDADALAFLDS